MRTFNFKAFMEASVCVKIIYGISFVLAIAAIVTVVLDFIGVCDIKPCVTMALCAASVLINRIVLRASGVKLYK